MLNLLRRWILPSSSSSSPALSTFFSPHYIPATTALATHRISHFSTYPPSHSDNKPSNPGNSKPSNNKPHPPSQPSPTAPSSSSTTSHPLPSTADDTLKPVVTPAWNELMTILSKHVYDSAWTPEAQAHYTHIMKQYPYISPETQYSTGLPIPGGMTSREACQSAAEEAFFADYRPLRAGFAEDYIETVDNQADIVFDFGNGVMQLPVRTEQLVELLKNVVGNDVDIPLAAAAPSPPKKSMTSRRMELTSTKRRRYVKMKNHKRRKL